MPLTRRGRIRPRSQQQQAAARKQMRDLLVARAACRSIEDLERDGGENLAFDLMIMDFVPHDLRGVSLVASLEGASIWFAHLWKRVPEDLREAYLAEKRARGNQG